MFEKLKSNFRSLWKKVVSDSSPEVLRQEVNVEIWRTLYQGAADWLDVEEIGVDGRKHKRRLMSLNPMKILAQTMTDYIYSEPPEIACSNRALMKVLEENNFIVQQQDMIEQQCALGSQALKLYQRGGEIGIDYVTPNNVVMLSWDNRRVTEAAFLDYQTIDGKNYVRVETHKKHYAQVPILEDDGETQVVDGHGIPVFVPGDQDGYTITNEFYKLEDSEVKAVEISSLSVDYESEVFVAITDPLFVIIKNPIANNMNTQTPIGMSIGGNSMDVFKALDVAYDSLATAPELCHPMILVSDRITRKVVDTDTGKTVSFFDPTDRVFRSAPIAEEEKAPIQDMTIPLDVGPIREAIQTNLDLLCIQAGLSVGTLSFDSAKGVVTATQIVSENSKTYRTRQKYVTSITEGYLEFFNVIQRLIGLNGEAAKEPSEVTITWDDSIIQDKTADATYWQGLYAGKVIPQWEMIMHVMGISEEDAKKKVEEIKAESPATVDYLGAA